MIIHGDAGLEKFGRRQQRIAEINAMKARVTETADTERSRLEWELACYLTSAGDIYIPSDNIERCVVDGATRGRQGKAVQAAVLVSDEVVLPTGFSAKRPFIANFGNPAFTLRKSVVVNRRRVMRCRPMLPAGWEITFTLEYDEDVIGEKALRKACKDAGALKGLGSWRPKYGRFTCEFPD
jgi:hypothetical protein